MTEPLAAPAERMGRPAVSPKWSLLVAESRTGRVVGRLPLAALSWSLPLVFGSSGALNASVKLDGPPGRDDRSVTRRVRGIAAGGPRFMLVAVYGTQAITYGFITSPVPNPATLEIGCTDLAGLLARRHLIKPGQWANPSAAAANTSLGPTSKPNLARLLFLQSIQEYGAELPLDIATVETSGTHTRTYLGADLASYTDRLADLGDDEDGPDIIVTPVLSVDQQWVRLKVTIGEPYVGQFGSEWTFNTGGNCVDVQPDYDFSDMGARTFVPGDGADEDKPVGVAYKTDLVDAGFPLLDRVNSQHTSTKDRALLNSYAAADAEVYHYALESLTLTVRADATPMLGTYARGDDLQVRTSKHWWLDDGVHRRRIVVISGDHTDIVTITTAPVPGGL